MPKVPPASVAILRTTLADGSQVCRFHANHCILEIGHPKCACCCVGCTRFLCQTAESAGRRGSDAGIRSDRNKKNRFVKSSGCEMLDDRIDTAYAVENESH